VAQEFRAIVTVLDRATAPLRAINRNLSALNAPFRGVGSVLTELGRQTGISNIARQAENAVSKVGALGSRIGGLLGPLAALGAAASAGGLLMLARETSDLGEELEKASIKTGLTVDQIAKLHHISEAMHIETSKVDRGLVMLNRTLADAARGKNKDAAALFHKLGINLAGVRKGTMNAATVLPVLSDAFMRNESVTMRNAMAQTLFKRSGAEMIPIMVLGRQELERLSAEYEYYFGKITPQMLKAMRDGHEAFERQSLAVKGLKLSIGAALIPAMTKLIVPLTSWIVNNRELISQRVGDWVTKVGNALQKVNWDGVGRSITGIARAIGNVVKFLGPMGTLIAGLTIIFAPFIAAVLSAGIALGQLALAISGVGLRLGLLAFGAITAAITTFFTAISLGMPIMEAFNLVLLMNPIGLVIIAIAALAAAAFLILKYWKPIKGFFKDLWATIVGVFSSAWAKIKPIVDAVMNVGRFLLNLSGMSPSLGFVQPGTYVFKNTGGAGVGPRAPSQQPVIQRFGGAGAGARAGANGQVNVKVDFNNLPQGARVQTRADPGIGLNTGVRFAF
jgi:hypothetical protein